METIGLSPEHVAEWRKHYEKALDQMYPLPDPWWRHPFRYWSNRSMRRRLMFRFESDRCARGR